jgi:DNA-binding SARP family transcriptional activator
MARFVLLGSMALLSGTGPVDAGPPKQRALLATLALRVGQTAAVETLIDHIWEERPPAEARKVLHSYITRARNTLAQASGGATDVAIRRSPGGYLLDLDPDHVDVHRFEELLVRARMAALSTPDREKLLAEALGLWQGEPLGGVPGAWADKVRESLRQQRLGAAVDWADILLAAGAAREVLPVLDSLARDHPLAEALAARLMRALAGSGRKSEALALFARLRRRIGEELGVEPGAELLEAHQLLLRTDRTEPPAPPQPQPQPRRPAGPAQLPPVVRGFVGRGPELRALDRVLIDADHDPHALAIALVSGTAGVGKTALAIRWANQRTDRFPDGQLYVDLHGYDVDRPVQPEVALTGFLRALGVRGGDVPLGLDELAAQYRTLLASRQMLVVLDNASSLDQLRPLLPGVASAGVLVTSRDSLPALVARHGARRISLGLLDLPDSLALLHDLLGERVDEDPAAAEMLVARCANLPLAVRIAAELAYSQPHKSLRTLAGELEDQQERLIRLGAGDDPRTAVTVVFSWSYDQLGPAAALAFRRLGLHLSPTFDEYSAAALTGADPVETRRALEVLARAHLIQSTGDDRYQMHDLLRAYAAGRAEGEEQAAFEGLIPYYVSRVGEAVDAAGGEDQEAAREALTWLDAERAGLVAACGHAAEHGPFPAAITLADRLWRHLDMGGYYAEAVTLHAYARKAAQHDGDLAAEARAVINLGVVAWRQSDFAQATHLFDAALRLAREAGDRLTEARALTNSGMCSAAQGHYAAALRHLEPGLETFLEIGHEFGAAGAYNNLAMIYIRQCRYPEAVEHLQLSMENSVRRGDRGGEACALTNLGLIAVMENDLDRGAELLTAGRELSVTVGDRHNEAHSLTDLGIVASRRGDHHAAVELHERALALFRQAGDAEGEADTLLNLGTHWRATRELGRAEEALTRSVETAEEHAAGWEEAAGRVELGHLHRQTGDLPAAHRQWRRALALYLEFGTPQAEEVRSLLQQGQ